MKALDPRRRQQLIWLAVPVFVLTVLALSVQARHLSRQWSPEISGAVLPGWDEFVADIDRIHIRTGDGSFTLERRVRRHAYVERVGVEVLERARRGSPRHGDGFGGPIFLVVPRVRRLRGPIHAS